MALSGTSAPKWDDERRSVGGEPRIRLLGALPGGALERTSETKARRRLVPRGRHGCQERSVLSVAVENTTWNGLQ